MLRFMLPQRCNEIGSINHDFLRVHSSYIRRGSLANLLHQGTLDSFGFLQRFLRPPELGA